MKFNVQSLASKISRRRQQTTQRTTQQPPQLPPQLLTRGDDLPDFGSLPNANKCLIGHNPKFPLRDPKRKVTGSTLDQSTRNGCPWCAIIFKAACRFFPEMMAASEDDYVFWRGNFAGFFDHISVMSDVEVAEIEIYTTPDQLNAVHKLPIKCLFPSSTDSDASLAQAFDWLQCCAESHPHCNLGPARPRLPTRIIDVGESARSPHIRLVETEVEYARYMCLSYRWGESVQTGQTLITTKATLQDHKEKISLSSLPKTFVDAIEFVRRLNCRYLWIDSICIVQDDDEDWERESAQMASIYQNSFLTIAAAHASNCKGGLFSGAADTLVEKKPLYLDSSDIPHPVYTRRLMSYKVGHLTSTAEPPLLTRGWVLQERLLSPRVIYFGANELAWECVTAAACECEPTFQANHKRPKGDVDSLDPKAAFSRALAIVDEQHGTERPTAAFWRTIMSQYTKLDLTYNKDKLPALCGLATRFATVRADDTYLAGLWKSSLMEDLLWHSTSIEIPYVSTAIVDNIIAPTWSWASASGSIHYGTQSLHSPQSARLIEAACPPLGQVPKAQSEAGYVILSGKLAALTLRQRGISRTYMLDSGTGSLLFSEPDYDLGSAKWGRRTFGHGDRVYAFRVLEGQIFTPRRMQKCFGLVLGAVEGSPGVYERLGMFEETFRPGEEWSVFGDVLAEVEVKIV